MSSPAGSKLPSARQPRDEEHIGAGTRAAPTVPAISTARNGPVIRTSQTQQIWESLYDVWHNARVKSISAYPSNLSLSSMESAPCQHSHREAHCVVYAFKGLARGFIVGFSLKTLFYVAVSIFSKQFLRRPMHVLSKAFFGANWWTFPRFLSLMGFVYRILQCLFCKLRGRPGKANSSLAAFIAGSTILMEDPGRRGTISMYLLVRACFEMARSLVYYGKVPSIPHLNVIIFALCQVPIMYSFLREPHALPASYHRWILGMGAITQYTLHHITYRTTPHHYACDPYWHSGSCIRYNFVDWLHAVFVRAVPIYMPVHLVPALLFKRKHVFKNPVAFAEESVVGILRSSLFLGTYVGFVKSGTCFWRWMLGDMTDRAAAFTGLTTGLALLWEHPRRHAEFAMYCVPRAFDIVANLYDSHFPDWLMWLRRTGYGDTLLFMTAVAMFVYRADTLPRMKGINGTIFHIIFGSGTQMIAATPARSGHGDEDEEAALRSPVLSPINSHARSSMTTVEELKESDEDDLQHSSPVAPRAQPAVGASAAAAASSLRLRSEPLPQTAHSSSGSTITVTAPSGSDSPPKQASADSSSPAATAPRSTGTAGLPPLPRAGSASSADRVAAAAAASSNSSHFLTEPAIPPNRRRSSLDINLYSPLTPVGLYGNAGGSALSRNVPPSPRSPLSPRSGGASGGTSSALRRKDPLTGAYIDEDRRSSLTDSFKWDAFFLRWPRHVHALSGPNGFSVNGTHHHAQLTSAQLFELDLYLVLSTLGFECWCEFGGDALHPTVASLGPVPPLALPKPAQGSTAAITPASTHSPLQSLRHASDPVHASPSSSPSVAATQLTLEAALQRELQATSSSRLLLCILNAESFPVKKPASSTAGANGDSESSHELDSDASSIDVHPLEGLRRVIRSRQPECLFPIFLNITRSQAQTLARASRTSSPSSRPRSSSFAAKDLSPRVVVPSASASGDSAPAASSGPAYRAHSPTPLSPSLVRASSSSVSDMTIGEMFAWSSYGVEVSSMTAEPSVTMAHIATQLAEQSNMDSACLARRAIVLPKQAAAWKDIFSMVHSAREELVSRGVITAHSVRETCKRLRATFLSILSKKNGGKPPLASRSTPPLGTTATAASAHSDHAQPSGDPQLFRINSPVVHSSSSGSLVEQPAASAESSASISSPTVLTQLGRSQSPAALARPRVSATTSNSSLNTVSPSASTSDSAVKAATAAIDVAVTSAVARASPAHATTGVTAPAPVVVTSQTPSPKLTPAPVTAVTGNANNTSRSPKVAPVAPSPPKSATATVAAPPQHASPRVNTADSADSSPQVGVPKPVTPPVIQPSAFSYARVASGAVHPDPAPAAPAAASVKPASHSTASGANGQGRNGTGGGGRGKRRGK